MLDVWPDPLTGDNCFHVFARSNYAREIKRYSDDTDDEAAFTRLCLEANNVGNLPAMEAAMRCNKESLMALMQPFLVFPNGEQLDRLLHHKNKEGQNLLAYVSHHNKVGQGYPTSNWIRNFRITEQLIFKIFMFHTNLSFVSGIFLYVPSFFRVISSPIHLLTNNNLILLPCTQVLSVAHGILIELEAVAHRHDSYAVKECLRTSLGSTVSAEFSQSLFKNIRHKPRDHLTYVTTFMRVLLLTFAIRTFSYGLDTFTDLILLFDYYRQWDLQYKVHFPGASIESSVSSVTFYDGDKCLFDHDYYSLAAPRDLFGGEWPTYNVTLGCYPGAIKGNERFFVTLVFMLLPFPLYFFELVRFRVFSRYIERAAASHPYPWLVMALKPFGNLFLWLTWPLVSFFRHFVYTFRYETTRNEDRAGDYQRKARKTSVISSRAQLIEVCTEASLQPIFQFYLIFQDFALDTEKWLLDLTDGIEYNRRQVYSVVISLITLSASYTLRYRQNKENSMGLWLTAYYFVSTLLLVVSRILCFELFAYYLGPGNFGFAMVAAACHVLLMSLLHIAFSDSLAQCRRFSSQTTLVGQLRQILLVTHNSLLNGLANLYVHNNLEIFIQKIKGEDDDEEKRGEKGAKCGKVSYMTSDVRQRTLVRQLVFDSVILVENLLMVYFAKDTVMVSNFNDPTKVEGSYASIHLRIACVIAATYTLGMAMKVGAMDWNL